MDCHYVLHHRPRRVAGLCDAASGASTIADAGFTIAIDNCDIDSRGAGRFPAVDPFVFARRNRSGIR